MNKILLAVAGILLFSLPTKAAPGDTTWVQSHAGTWLDWYGDFDTTVNFPQPGTSYRNIYMVFTLGKYSCPGNPQYCADWDYTVQTKLLTQGGDTVELGRLITPYANSSRMGPNWKGVYVFDVTDFVSLLQNSATVRVHYSGYSGGFTADVKFAFVEGTPERDVIGLAPIWKGSYDYGHGSTPINTALDNVALTAPANTGTAELKFTVTGHGGDAQGCAEFCPNTYTINLNNNLLTQQNFWRDDCGFNDYYPQNGTWVFDRAGWCPGDLIYPFSHELTGITSGSNFTVNATFPSYTSVPNSSGSKASYIIEGTVVYYGAMNKTLDASIQDIIAPTTFEGHFRENVRVGNPVIRVRNSGSTPVSSLKIQYGTPGYAKDVYTWNGQLAARAETEITLPEYWPLRDVTDTSLFEVSLLEVNGQTDDDATNDQLHSVYAPAPKWPTTLIIRLVTNLGTVAGVSENSWQILDMNGSVVAERINNQPQTTYIDTVHLGPAPYQLVVHDGGCDGMNWWWNKNSVGIASISVRRTTSLIPLPLRAYYAGDFGCGFSQYFSTDWPTAVENISGGESVAMNLYPNPADGEVTIRIEGLQNVNGQISVIDVAGRIQMQQEWTQTSGKLDISQLANGSYIILYHAPGGTRYKERLVIAR